MKRRDFLKQGAALAVAAPAAPLAAAPAAKSKVAVVRNGEPNALFQKGIAALGGITAFVKPGQKVVVKPNIGWDRAPEFAANTNPILVGEIVRQCIAAGAAQVEVFDHTCSAWSRCYRTSGIAAAVEAAGGKMVRGDDKDAYREVERPQALNMKKALIHRAILDADVFINVPILKHHGGAKMTACLKNFMGLVWDRQYMHAHNLDQCIADAALYRKPDLNVIDAYRIMPTNGPRGVTLNDVRTVKYQILSTDIVAADVLACKLLRTKPADVRYVALAAKHGLGTDDESRIDVVRLEA